MELHALHVDELRTGPQRHRVAVAGALPRVRRELPRLASATRRQNDGLGLEGDELTGRAPVPDAAGDASLGVVDELEDLALHEHVGAHGDDFLLQGADEFQTRTVTNVGEARVAVSAEVALQDLAVLGPVEERAPLLEFPDAIRCFFGVQFGHAVVGVGLAEEGLGDNADLQAALARFDGGTKPRAAGADDQYVVLVVFGRCVGHERVLKPRKACSRRSRPRPRGARRRR